MLEFLRSLVLDQGAQHTQGSQHNQGNQGTQEDRGIQEYQKVFKSTKAINISIQASSVWFKRSCEQFKTQA